VLTANMTRREAARRAQEQLVRQGVTVLGVVLDERKLPIPEPIYRRL
jgi:Mrp family chromosome partitioning ATPase